MEVAGNFLVFSKIFAAFFYPLSKRGVTDFCLI